MKNTSPNNLFQSLALLAFALIGLFAICFYFLAEIHQPEYLVYFAPILGLLFYSAYYLINRKLDTGFLHGAYPDESTEA